MLSRDSRAGGRSRTAANLALGFACLQANQPARGRDRRSARVRLKRSVLEQGAAGASAGRNAGAWGLPGGRSRRGWSCANRDVLDAAVQEVLPRRALRLRQVERQTRSPPSTTRSAVKSFDAENGQLDEAIAADRGRAICSRRRCWAPIWVPATAGFWQLKSLPDAPESRYLYAVLGGTTISRRGSRTTATWCI